MNEKPPFVIDVHEDTVTIEAIADFVAGRTVVSVARRRWWFLKAGWCVGFIPAAEAEEARRTGATVIRWPPAL